MNSHVDYYLDFMSIKNGRFFAQTSNIDLKKAIVDICDHYKRLAIERGLKYSYKVDYLFPSSAKIDRERL